MGEAGALTGGVGCIGSNLKKDKHQDQASDKFLHLSLRSPPPPPLFHEKFQYLVYELSFSAFARGAG